MLVSIVDVKNEEKFVYFLEVSELKIELDEKNLPLQISFKRGKEEKHYSKKNVRGLKVSVNGRDILPAEQKQKGGRKV